MQKCSHKNWDDCMRRCKDCKRTQEQIVTGDNGPPEILDEFTLRRVERSVVKRYKIRS